MSTSDQLKFALSCFRNCSPGTIDWKAVANDCDIVTTGAAQKRWERLNKANGGQTFGNGGAGNAASAATPQPKEKGKGKTAGRAGGRGSRGPASKKRKIVEQDEEEDDGQHCEAAEGGEGLMGKGMLGDANGDDGDAEQDKAFIKDEWA